MNTIFPIPRTAVYRMSVSVGIILVNCLAIPNASSEPEKIRNVLMIVSDDLKASVLGGYGDQVCKTPNIDRLANEGMVFERAYCQGTVCGPSRTSFMRSRYRDKAGITLGEHFRSSGFYTARVGKIFHMRVPGDIIAGTDGQDVPDCWTERFNAQGLEAHTPGNYACLNLNIFTTKLEGRQSTKMPHRMFVSVDYEGDGSAQPDYKAADQTIELLRQRAKNVEQRFFIACGFVRPHYPSVAPIQYFDPYPHDKIDLPISVDDDLSDIPPQGQSSSRSDNTGIAKYPENQQRMWSAYYATVSFMDEQLGRVLDELDKLGLRESTAVVFLSDHGYHLGEHGFWQKQNLHEDVVRVPLVVSAPGYSPGRSESLVELVDVYPTLNELTGIGNPKSVEGKSLVPVLKDPKKTIRRSAISFIKRGQGIRTDSHAYMRYKSGEEEVYDMASDPKQFRNLADAPDHKGDLARLRDLFDKRKQ